MATYTYDSHGNDTATAHRDGQSVDLVRAVRRPDNEHDADTLPMYVVRFADGETISVWCDELRPHRHSAR